MSVNKRRGVGLFIYLFTKTVAVIREVENVGEVYWSGKSLNYDLQFKIYGTTKTSFTLLYEITSLSVRRKTSELT
jgi:hypothetical protein